MSFDDYANHIYQKHRLAAALAIIKSKPINVTTEEFLETLKSKVEDKMEDEDDITVCSDDFILDDDDAVDSQTILKDFDEEIIGHQIAVDDGSQPIHVPENSQTTFYESSQSTSENITNTNSDTVKAAENNKKLQLVINGSNEPKELNKEISTNFDLNAEMQLGEKYHNDQKINDQNDPKNINENTDATYYDSQKTQIYSVYGFSQNYTHYSQSQNNVTIPKQYLYKNSLITSKTNISDVINVESEKNIEIVKEKDTIENNNNNFEIGDGINNITKVTINNSIKNSNIVENINSNDENNDIFVMDDNNKGVNSNKVVIDNHSQYSQNIDDYFSEMQNFHDVNTIEMTNMDLDDENNNTDTFSRVISEHTEKNNENTEFINANIYQLKDLTENIPKNTCADVISEKYTENFRLNTINRMPSRDVTEITHSNGITYLSNENFERNNINLFPNNDSQEEYNITEEDYESDEIISFKVLEEFNKVKTFLRRPNRRVSYDSYSSDSGYKSDSQKSNRSALQLSGSWINQSGSCLFHYLLQCPLVASTRDITSEIAQVLGELIDKLHDEEKYPTFLEELLENIEVALQKVFDGVNSEENEFLKKDERIQRILLLNKSTHIQTHTIEKITNILAKFHANIIEIDSTYELQNIDEIENISYIFHILEILLKKYLKNKQNESQPTTQNSQEIIKKTSISDIWRKKWNPSQKKIEGSREKKCVLKECSDILNKIVVDCVSVYSLVAYSALKCFNSLQS